MTTKTETTPDQLMESFKGRSFKSIILFTVIAHAVVIGATSVPYLMKSVSGKSDAKLSDEERLEQAAREATASLKDIASKHGIKPQDLSARISGDAPAPTPKAPTPAPKEETTAPTPPTENTQPTEPEKPKTAIEEKLEVKKEGPTVPPVPTEEAGDEDLFR